MVRLMIAVCRVFRVRSIMFLDWQDRTIYRITHCINIMIIVYSTVCM